MSGRRAETDFGHFRVVREWGDGADVDYTFVSFPRPGARILAVENGAVLLVRQHRHPHQGYLWEVPAGGVEVDETPLEAAKRELWEEGGFVASAWDVLGESLPLPNVTDFKGVTFLAEGLSRRPKGSGGAFHEVEDAKFFSMPEVHELIRQGELIDEKTLAAIFLYQSRLTGRGLC